MLLIEIADDDQRRIVGTIIGIVKLDNVCYRRRVEIFNAANRRALVRMSAERFLIEDIKEAAVRRGEHALPVLFLHDGPLRLEILFVNSQRGQPLGLSP